MFSVLLQLQQYYNTPAPTCIGDYRSIIRERNAEKGKQLFCTILCSLTMDQ